MYTSTILAACLATTVLGVSNPHRRVPKRVQRSPIVPEELPLRKRQSSSYLTQATESEYSYTFCGRNTAHVTFEQLNEREAGCSDWL